MAEKEKSSKTDKEKSGTIRYAFAGIGVRTISRAEWAAVGVDHEPVRWDASNNWTVSQSDISDEAMPFLRDDPELNLSTSDKDGPTPATDLTNAPKNEPTPSMATPPVGPASSSSATGSTAT